MAFDMTVVIVSWNTMELLNNCLQSISENKNEVRMKIIVVDNDSKDGSTSMIRTEHPDVKLIESGGNFGFGRANNIAKQYIEGDSILFLNPDTIVLDDAIDRMKKVLDDNRDIGAVSCKTVYPDGEVQQLGLQWFPSPLTELINILIVTSTPNKILKKTLPYKDPLDSGYVKKLYGGCLLVRKSILDEVGWFDERFFMYGEDVDLCRRITEAGWKLYYLSNARIIHLCGGASNKSTSEYSTLMMCDSISKLMSKYYGVVGCLSYRAVIFVGSNVRLFVVLMIKIFNNLVAGSRNADYEDAVNKYKAMLKWSLNIQNPTIPS